MRSKILGAIVLISVLGVACSKPKSFIVLTLRSLDASMPIPAVKKVIVTVTQPASSFSKVLTYPVSDANGLTLDQTNKGNTLSVSFAGGHSGRVDLGVEAQDAAGCRIGLGSVSVTIREGADATGEVALQSLHDCAIPDGGVDATTGDTFPGCDPAEPALLCSATQTCQVNCATSKGECTKAGDGGAGAACLTNASCAPGLQCFDYSAGGCHAPNSDAGVHVCLRFCNGNGACQGPGGADAGRGDGGTGTTSVCEGLVPCGKGLTAYHTCTFACDPRQTAIAAGTTGCPAGLACMVVADMDQVDCACPEQTRTGVDGDDCASGAQCAPGFICNLMSAVKKCRAVCRCDATGMSCTAPNDCSGGKVCSALTNDTTFGVCL